MDRGGDYFLVVKDNGPRLREDIALVFASPPPVVAPISPATPADRAARWDKGHGWI